MHQMITSLRLRCHGMRGRVAIGEIVRDRRKEGLAAKGWKLASAGEFLGLSSKDSAEVETRLRHANGPRAPQTKRASHATVKSQERRHQRIRFALAAAGAPVGAPRRNPPPADLEATLADGLVLAHRDATLARTLPLVFWRQRNRFKLDRLVVQASRRGERFSLGLFLELAGHLGHEPTLIQAARRLRDRRRTAVRLFFSNAHGPIAMAMARRYTPQVARRWGYLMNMAVDSFRTLFDKFARLDLDLPANSGHSLRLRARLARAEGPNAVLVRGVHRR
jgi:hypothetical protein